MGHSDRDTAPGDATGAGRAPTMPDGVSGVLIADELPPGTILDRYVLLHRIGAGGMGVVYAAHDPELDRRVAIKLLRSRGTQAAGQARLRREAQAMARLSHPAVVPVFDVGTHADHLFVAMELVEGQTLTRWLQENCSGWRSALDILLRAGRGLAAAHDAGIVHRDFKPDNVLVGRDARVQVTDFGLARLDADDAPMGPGASPTGTQAAAITQVGAVMGTPAYMAPEQHRGGPVGAAADQFSFCVTLYEALHGRHPFRCDETDGVAPSLVLAGEVMVGRVQPPPRDSEVPARLHRILLRGLAVAPVDRWPTMADLLDALERATVRPRRWPLLAAAAVVAATALSALWFTRHRRGFVATSGVLGKAVTMLGEQQGGAPPAAIADERAAKRLTHRGCAYAPTFIDDDTVVYDLTDERGTDLWSLRLSTGEERRLTTAPTQEWRAAPGPTPGSFVHVVTDLAATGDNASSLALASLKGDSRPLGIQSAWASFAGDALYYGKLDQTEVRRRRGGVDETVAVIPRSHLITNLIAGGDRVAVQIGLRGPLENCLLVDGRLDCRPGTTTGRPGFGPDGTLYVAASDGVRRWRDDARIVAGGAAGGGVAVTPAGNALVYSTCGTHTHVYEVDGGKRRPILDEGVYELGDGVGGRLVFVRRNVDRRGVLVVRDTDGLERALTRPELGSASAPQLSPDGRQVVFHLAGAGLYLVDADGKQAPHALTEDASDDRPRWLDDEHVVFNRMATAGRDPGDIWLVSTDGHLQAGPRSRALLTARHGVAYLAFGERILRWRPGAGTESPAGIRLPPGSEIFAGALSADGRSLILQPGLNFQDVWRYPLSGDAPERIASAAPGESSRTVSVCDDGRILFPVETWSGDLYLVPARPGTRF